RSIRGSFQMTRFSMKKLARPGPLKSCSLTPNKGEVKGDIPVHFKTADSSLLVIIGYRDGFSTISLILSCAICATSAFPLTPRSKRKYKELPNLRQRETLPLKTGSLEATMDVFFCNKVSACSRRLKISR